MYQVLANADAWVVNVGYPGYSNAAIAEIMEDAGLISSMLVQAASGKMTPEEALTQADREVRKIFQTWQDLGKV